MPQTPPPKTLLQTLIEFLFGGLVCIGLPACMTALAPVTWLEFTRTGERVGVKTQTCCYFVIPYRVSELADVKRIDTTFHPGEQQQRRPGDRERGQTEDEAALVLLGPQAGQQIWIPVSPASIKSVEARVQAFLNDPQPSQLSLFTVANWKFGLIFAIPLCLLTVLYIVGWSMWLGQTLAKPFQLLRLELPAEYDEPTHRDAAEDDRANP